MKNLNGKFIHGPVWCEWISEASKLSPTTGFIGSSLWFYDHIHKGHEFPIDWKLASMTNLCRQTIYKGLRNLEEAGLITVTRPDGSYPTVRICKDRYCNPKTRPNESPTQLELPLKFKDETGALLRWPHP